MIRAEHFRAVLDAFLAKVRDREGGVTGQQSHSRSCGDGRRDTEAAVEAAAAEAGRRAQEQAARKMEGSGGQRAEGAHAGSERQQAQGGVTEERGWGLQQGYTAAKEAGRGRAGGQLAGPTRREEQGCVVPGGDQLSSHPWELREAPLVSDGAREEVCGSGKCVTLRHVASWAPLASWGQPGRDTRRRSIGRL